MNVQVLVVVHHVFYIYGIMELTLFEGFKGVAKIITCQQNERCDEMIWIHNWFLSVIPDHGTDYSRQRKVQRKFF